MPTAVGQKTVVIIWILLAPDFVDVLWLHGMAGSLLRILLWMHVFVHVIDIVLWCHLQCLAQKYIQIHIYIYFIYYLLIVRVDSWSFCFPYQPVWPSFLLALFALFVDSFLSSPSCSNIRHHLVEEPWVSVQIWTLRGWPCHVALMWYVSVAWCVSVNVSMCVYRCIQSMFMNTFYQRIYELWNPAKSKEAWELGQETFASYVWSMCATDLGKALWNTWFSAAGVFPSPTRYGLLVGM